MAKIVWQCSNMVWVLSKAYIGNWEWLTWLFKESSNTQYQLICYALWVLWSERKKQINEGENNSGKVISRQDYVLYAGE